MNEFIKKLIERLEERKQLHERMIAYESKNGTVTEEFQARKAVEVVEKAIEIVNQLAKEYNGGWIPCSERLPEVEADVLLSLRSLDIYTGFRANTEGMFYVEGEGYVEYENTLAWQPLPAPYQPKGE